MCAALPRSLPQQHKKMLKRSEKIKIPRGLSGRKLSHLGSGRPPVAVNTSSAFCSGTGNDFRFFARLRPSKNFFLLFPSASDPIDGLQLSASSAHSFDSIEPIASTKCCRLRPPNCHFAAIFRTKSLFGSKSSIFRTLVDDVILIFETFKGGGGEMENGTITTLPSVGC